MVEATMEVDTMTVTMGHMDLGAVEPVEAIEVVRTRDPEVEEEVHPFVGETPPGVGETKLILPRTSRDIYNPSCKYWLRPNREGGWGEPLARRGCSGTLGSYV